jgi:beta-glucosidase
MKLNRFFALVAATAALASCNTSVKVAPAIPHDKEIEAKVEKILKDMTLEEKVGQMTQVTTGVVANGLDITPLGDSLIRTYKIGSVLNTPEDRAQSPEGYDRYIKELNRISMEEMGIPCLYGLDHIHACHHPSENRISPIQMRCTADSGIDDLLFGGDAEFPAGTALIILLISIELFFGIYLTPNDIELACR